jgi:hypothetical protein
LSEPIILARDRGAHVEGTASVPPPHRLDSRHFLAVSIGPAGTWRSRSGVLPAVPM